MRLFPDLRARAVPGRCGVVLLLAVAACGGAAENEGAGAASGAGERPATRTDTLVLEGLAEPIALRLFRTPDDFPLPFSAYVPEDMAATIPDVEGEGAALRFEARFGGVPNERAFVHVFVYPPGTDPQTALATVRAFQAADGIPVGRGLAPLGDAEAARDMAWAEHAYTLRIQGDDEWYLGSIGIGANEGRLFHVLSHYPAEYGDGFVPRADLILETWRWADGGPLQAGGGRDITIPSARADSPDPE